MRKSFKDDIERDAMILSASLNGHPIIPLVMQRPEFAGGPDRLQAYYEWISHPSKGSYRRRVAKFLEPRSS